MNIYMRGYVRFQEGITEEEKRKVIQKLEGILKTNLVWNEAYRVYFFNSLIAQSYEYRKVIIDLVEENKAYLDWFECSLFYLEKSDEVLEFSKGKWVCDFI